MSSVPRKLAHLGKHSLKRHADATAPPIKVSVLFFVGILSDGRRVATARANHRFGLFGVVELVRKDGAVFGKHLLDCLEVRHIGRGNRDLRYESVAHAHGGVAFVAEPDVRL